MDLAKTSVLAVVTGASRGFGRSIAEALLQAATTQHAHKLALVLQACSTSGTALRHVETHMMTQYLTAETHAISTALSITILPLDLERPDVKERATHAIETAQQVLDEPIDHALLFNNAQVFRPGDMASDGFAARLEESLAVNVSATAAFSDAFLATTSEVASRHVILSSSQAAAHASASWASFCASKAAADMLHACLALERPDVRVLRYAPGALCTEMAPISNNAPQTSASKPSSVSNNLLDGSQLSARRLIRLLQTGQFHSGGHVHFYDA